MAVRVTVSKKHHIAVPSAEYRLRPAGALHVAACLEQGATAFLSNDRERRRITHLHVWMLADFA
jgi:predicted nucleic acid-binding protein